MPLVSHRVVWIELKRALELLLGRAPIPIEVVLDEREYSVRFSERRIE